MTKFHGLFESRSQQVLASLHEMLHDVCVAFVTARAGADNSLLGEQVFPEDGSLAIRLTTAVSSVQALLAAYCAPSG